MKKVIEIGVYKGGTLRLWLTIAAQDAILIGVDTQDHTSDMFSHEKNIFLVFGPSESSRVIAKVKKIIGDNVDLLFIDGGHSYKVVKSDYENYGPLVKKGGLIIFHDTHRHAGISRLAPGGCNVKMFWRELIDKNVFKEYYEFFINSSSPIKAGTGIIVK